MSDDADLLTQTRLSEREREHNRRSELRCPRNPISLPSAVHLGELPVAVATGWTRVAREALKDEGYVKFRKAFMKKILKAPISSNLNVSSYKATEMDDMETCCRLHRVTSILLERLHWVISTMTASRIKSVFLGSVVTY